MQLGSVKMCWICLGSRLGVVNYGISDLKGMSSLGGIGGMDKRRWRKDLIDIWKIPSGKLCFRGQK